jgi:hypothetical protein
MKCVAFCFFGRSGLHAMIIGIEANADHARRAHSTKRVRYGVGSRCRRCNDLEACCDARKPHVRENRRRRRDACEQRRISMTITSLFCEVRAVANITSTDTAYVDDGTMLIESKYTLVFAATTPGLSCVSSPPLTSMTSEPPTTRYGITLLSQSRLRPSTPAATTMA